MRTEAPERVLVGAELAEVEALGVQVVDVAEVALFDQVGELADPGVATEQVPDHQGQVALGGQGHDALSQGRVLGQRLLDEAVLARLQRPDRQVPVGRDGRRDRHRLQLGVREQLVKIGGEVGVRVDRRGRAREASSASQHQARSQPSSAFRLRAMLGPW